MVVPVPGWRDNEVARVHQRFLTVNGGEGVGAFDDEAQRILGVTVCRRYVAWHHELEPSIQRARDRRFPAHAGVLQDEHATLSLARCDELARLHQKGTGVVIMPDMRHRRTVRLRRD